MSRVALVIGICLSLLQIGAQSLATGVAGHAFDHLGEIADQAPAAAASGAANFEDMRSLSCGSSVHEK